MSPGPIMPRRKLGANGPLVSVLGFGAASLWGHRWFSEQRATELVQAAAELGINLFDTGPSYSGGNAERRLGRALAACGADDLLVSTKVGTVLDSRGRVVKDCRPEAVRASFEQSLRRLGLERVAILFLHGPALEHLSDELLLTLDDLRQCGDASSIGLNSFEPVVIDHCLGLGVFDCLMVDYSPLRREREPLIERWAAAGCGVLAAGALARAVLGRRLWRLRGPRDLWYLARILATRRDDLRRARGLRFLNQTPAWSAEELSLAFVLAHPGITTAMVGTTDLSHLQQNAAAVTRELPDDLRRRLAAPIGENS